MTKYKLLLSTFLVMTSLYAQSFYVLSGVKSYDPVVANMTTLVDKKYNSLLKEAMQDISDELKIDTANHPSSVLALVLSTFSVGDTVAIKMDLELGEYMAREGSKQKIFALSYVDTRMFKPDDLEEDLSDNLDEMLEKFAEQYRDDNKKLTVSQKEIEITHENFAEIMGYEREYQTALAKAKKLHKPLLIFMTTNYCPWCRKLETRILAKANIHAKIMDKYVPLMLNFDKKNFPKNLQNIALTPTLYILNSQSEKIEHTFVGYSSREEFLHLLK